MGSELSVDWWWLGRSGEGEEVKETVVGFQESSHFSEMLILMKHP